MVDVKIKVAAQWAVQGRVTGQVRVIDSDGREIGYLEGEENRALPLRKLADEALPRQESQRGGFVADDCSPRKTNRQGQAKPDPQEATYVLRSPRLLRRRSSR